MADDFSTYGKGLTSPTDTWVLAVPHASTNFALRPRGILCSAAGTAQMVDGAGTVMPVAMTAGQFVPFRPIRINAVDTTGTYYGLY